MMDKPKINQYEKIITINDQSKQTILKCMSILTEFIYEFSEQKKENMQYFRLRLMDSEHSVNAKDLKLEWASLSYEKNYG